jgi:steroid 5-alpha reductase family enzyme
MTTLFFDYTEAILRWALLPGLALFALTWFVARRLDNWSIVDVVWSYGFALIAGLLVFVAPGPTGRPGACDWGPTLAGVSSGTSTGRMAVI